jgi:putative MFS transporter
MFERLDQARSLTHNQIKIIGAAIIGDMLEFFDYFLIGFVLAFIIKPWNLTFGESAIILLSSGVGAILGAFIWGRLADVIGRRKVFMATVLNFSVASGILALTPENGWVFLSTFRFFVGFGVGGLYVVDLPLVQEFVPARKRGWVSALITTLLPGGGMLAGLVASFLLPIVGWRYLFLVGLSPLVLVLMIRYWVPESPHWLIRMGRHEEARNSLAWALMIDPKEIVLPATLPAAEEKTRWLDLFKYPKLVATGCMTGLTQTGGASFGLWGATLLVIVLNTSPAHAAFLMVFTGVSGIAGRFFITALIEPMGRRGAGTLACGMAGLLTISAGYLYDVFIGGWSLFYMLMIAGTFFSSSIYTVVGPYMSEIWPTRLRSSGMGMSYGIGNLGGKVLGPAGLAVIMGAGDIIKPAAPNLKMLGPAFVYFASWYILGIIGFWVFGPETKGRTFEEMDSALSHPAGASRAIAQTAGS